MSEIALVRVQGDRHRHELPGYGVLVRSGLLRPRVHAETVEGGRYAFSRSGFRRTTRAVDARGATAGIFTQTKRLSHTGIIRWRGTDYGFTSDGRWTTRYLLSDADGPIARITASSWGRTAATVDVQRAGCDPGLMLFAAWLVTQLRREDTASATVATTS